MMEKEQIPFNEAFEKAIMPRIVEDCTEAGKNEAETKEVIRKLKHEFEKMFLMESQEKADIDNFLNQTSTLTGFEQIGSSKNPAAAAQQKIEDITKKNPKMKWVFGGISAYIVKWANDLAKDNGGKDTWLGTSLKKLAELLGGGKKKEKNPNTPAHAATATAPTAPAAQAETGTETAAEQLNEKQKQYIDVFKERGLTLDSETIDEDIKKLNKKTPGIVIKDALEAAMAKKGGRLNEVVKAVKEVLPNETFAWRLTDLSVQSTATGEVAQLINNKIEKNPDAIRKFLNELADSSNKKEVIDRYKA
ncbi:hypothetical protein KAR91_00980 [Candidatus Pacearchaeota archaeon]|nr:hypothetical protein [Candidatus Pacearchaeota archaeon]